MCDRPDACACAGVGVGRVEVGERSGVWSAWGAWRGRVGVRGLTTALALIPAVLGLMLFGLTVAVVLMLVVLVMVGALAQSCDAAALCPGLGPAGIVDAKNAGTREAFLLPDRERGTGRGVTSGPAVYLRQSSRVAAL